MERKVGEIFEYNGEWYQCVEGTGCYKCAFYDKNICIANNPHCTCRSDKKNVIFKKLEKVGEPEIINGKKVQSIVTGYVGCAFCIFKKGGACLSGGTCKNRGAGTIYVEVKQNKENMEESAELKLFADRTSNVNEVYMEKRLCNRLKPFNLEAAKAGKPVCTRDGRKARIICFDRKISINGVSYPIITLVEDTTKEEIIYGYNEKGRLLIERDMPYKDDLMMLPEKKEGYVNIYTNPRVGDRYSSNTIFPSKEEAIQGITKSLGNYINTTKIEWEE